MVICYNVVEVMTMPKRKTLPKVPHFEGMGAHSEYAEIQKARPLQSLAESELTLPEFKILDAYLARINSHDPDKRTVRLEKGELEKALGVTEIKQDDLEKRLRHLFQIIEVKDERKRKGFKLINLFEEADAEQDEDGLWQITLTCTASAREYVFNIDNIGYLRYRLKNVINLTSRYSYVLFLYLLDNRFRKTWSINLVDLKALLNCKGDAYKQYYRFNDLVLKKCHKELCEKTDISFDYKPIKRGRSVSAVEFTVATVSDELANASDQLPEQLSIIDFDDKPQEIEYGGELADLLGSAACDDEFSPEQVRVLQDLVIKAVPNGDDIERCDYLIHQIHKMNAYDKDHKTVKNRFNYLCRMIEQELKEKENILCSQE